LSHGQGDEFGKRSYGGWPFTVFKRSSLVKPRMYTLLADIDRGIVPDADVMGRLLCGIVIHGNDMAICRLDKRTKRMRSIPDSVEEIGG